MKIEGKTPNGTTLTIIFSDEVSKLLNATAYQGSYPSLEDEIKCTVIAQLAALEIASAAPEPVRRNLINIVARHTVQSFDEIQGSIKTIGQIVRLRTAARG